MTHRRTTVDTLLANLIALSYAVIAVAMVAAAVAAYHRAQHDVLPAGEDTGYSPAQVRAVDAVARQAASAGDIFAQSKPGIVPLDAFLEEKQ